MKTSGNAINLAPLPAASSISAIDLSIDASRSSQAGAACTTATLYFGCSMPIAASIAFRLDRPADRFPVDRGACPMHSIGPKPGDGRSTAAEQKIDWAD